MNYEKKYKEALERARAINNGETTGALGETVCEFIFPELKESEDGKIRKAILALVKQSSEVLDKQNQNNMIAWLEKQGNNLVKNGYTKNKDYIRYADRYSYEIWRKLMDNFKNIKDYHIGCNEVSDIVLNAIIDTFNWLEKGGDKNKVSKHVEAINEEKIDDANKVEPKDYDSEVECDSCIEKQGESDETKAKMFLIKKGYPIDANGTFPTYKEMCNIIRERLKKIAKTCVTMCNPDAYRIGFADGEAHAKVVKPKFNIDDWIVHKGTRNIYKVVAIINNKYQLKYGDNYTVQKCVDVDECARLWTIRDAKAGDVLITNKGSIFIYAKVLYNQPYAYCGINSFGLFKHDCLGNSWANSINGIHPATKEQRNTLEKEMAYAGYTFDFEKKELKKIEQKSYGQRKECLDYQFNYAGKGFVAVDNCGDKTIYNPTGRRVAFFQKKPVRDLLTDNHYWATHISPYDVIHLGYKDFPKLKWEDEPIEVKIIISTDSYCQENCRGFQETGKCFADGDCEAKREAESVDKFKSTQ